MSLKFFTHTSRHAAPRRAARPRPRLVLSLEEMESRTVLSQLAPAPAPAAEVAAVAAPTIPISITGLNITSITRSAAGVVSAVGTLTGTLLNTPFSTPITITPSAAGSTPILDLDLAPIHLGLLGLNVDTSAICLDITAQSGPGNLLGNLLGDVAHLLDKNNPGAPGNLAKVNNLLASPTSLNGLTTILGDVTGLLSSPSAIQASPATNILHLAVGPLDLTVLGLNVHLDNCNNGPVTVDITALPGPGNLLGNLLGDVAGLANNVTGLSITGVTQSGGVTSAVGTLTGTLLNQPFSTPITITPSAAGSTPILDLMLGPIHLSLLGLNVDTSPICLDITALPGPGNLLGNLLSGVAHLLDGNNPGVPGHLLRLNNLLSSPTVLNGLTTALQDLTGALASSTPVPSATSILSLAVGPLDLTVLGLNVHLDNCNNGPVTLNITAVPGAGNLLGNLLADIAGIANGGPLSTIQADLQDILNILSTI